MFLPSAHRRGHISAIKQLQREGRAQRLSTRDALLLQLTAMYRAWCWWMASAVLLRRLTIVVLLTVIRGPTVWTWLTLANNSLLTLHVLLAPYERQGQRLRADDPLLP